MDNIITKMENLYLDENKNKKQKISENISENISRTKRRFETSDICNKKNFKKNRKIESTSSTSFTSFISSKQDVFINAYWLDIF